MCVFQIEKVGKGSAKLERVHLEVTQGLGGEYVCPGVYLYEN